MINICIIGTSNISKDYIKSFKKLGINISSIYSRDINRAEKLTKEFNIKNFTDKLDDILENKNINAAIILTEPNRHLDLAESFIQNNIDVLIEKPIDVDFIKSKIFLEKFRNSDRIIDIVSQQRFNPIVNDFKKKFSLENLSDPGILNLKVFYNRDKNYFLNGNQWRKKYSNPVLNQGIHWIDFINEVFGEIIEIKSLNFKFNKMVENSDNIISILKNKNNKLISFSASTNISNNRDFFSYYSNNFKFSYKKEFYKYILTKPHNYFKLKNSYLIFLQCKFLFDCI